MPFAATWVDLEIIILSEVSQKGKDKYHMIYHSYVESKKNGTNELMYKTETDSQTLKTKLWLPKGKGGGRDKLGVWDKCIHTAIYKIIDNNLLYSTGNSTQYSVITYMGK